MPRRDISCRCGGTGFDGCRVREDAGFGIAELRRALASDAANHRGLASAIFIDNVTELMATVDVDAAQVNRPPSASDRTSLH
jgi:hypothetical protein